MNSNLSEIILSMAAADALGSSFEGFTRAHIEANIKDFTDYPDPSKLLTRDFSRWRKPGLYTSITQTALLLILSSTRGRIQLHALKQLFSSPESSPEFLRNTDPTERSFAASGGDAPSTQPSARVCALLTPLAGNSPDLKEVLMSAISFARHYTEDLYTIAGAGLHVLTVSSLINNTEHGILSISEASMAMTSYFADFIKTSPHIVFNEGLNPDQLEKILMIYQTIIKNSLQAVTLKEAEDIICKTANLHLKTPVKRPSINHPLTLIPLSLFLTSMGTRMPEGTAGQTVVNAAAQGGSSSAAASITAAYLTALKCPSPIPENFLEKLVNKKTVSAAADSIAQSAKLPFTISEFIHSESKLTAKAQSELTSKLKHQKAKPVRKKISRSIESDIAHHVVESWTKTDKARWKKQRRKDDPSKWIEPE